jgi:hypothetical protein
MVMESDESIRVNGNPSLLCLNTDKFRWVHRHFKWSHAALLDPFRVTAGKVAVAAQTDPADDKDSACRNVRKYSVLYANQLGKPIQRPVFCNVLALVLFIINLYKFSKTLRVFPLSVAESNVGLSLP